jgi:hypothetical protein
MQDLNNLKQGEKGSFNPFKFIVDGLLLLFAFMFAFFLKRGNVNFDGIYIKFLPIYFSCWLISCIFTSKFSENIKRERDLISLEPYVFSAFYFTGLLSLIIYGLELYNLSRFIIYGSIIIYLLLEILIISGAYLPFFRHDIVKKKKLSLKLIFIEFILISAGFFIIHYLKMGTVIISSETYHYILISLYLLWFLVALFTHRFQLNLKEEYFRMIYPFFKSYLITLSIFSSVIFGLRIKGFSRFLVFGSIAIYAFMELLILTVGYLLKHVQKSDIPEIDFFDAPLLSEDKVVNGIIEKERTWQEKYSLRKKKFKSGLIREKLSRVYLKNYPKVFEYINNSVELDSINIIKTEIMDTGNPYNVNILPKNYFELYVNLHELNSFRYMNKYLIEVNRILKKGGIAISKFEPCERRFFYFKKKYPMFFARLFYFFDFIWKRIFPKLPFLKKFYFVITKGRTRVFSMAQGLGRLYYCGFEIISIEELDNFVWFALKKVKKPEERAAPSYGFFFKQKRIGKGGGFIYIYKMRTMHAYSEFIHKYIYERNKLDEKGKIMDDFRITSWGKIFRKLWIDELPMIFNWLRRDVKLVGVRPLSETIFNTYPEKLQKERVKFKPGLIPPYYADMPGSMEDVWDSEER